MKLKYLSWLPAAIIMGTIFWFSSKTADISGESSLFISVIVVDIYSEINENHLSGTEYKELLLIVDHIVRKSAHFTEYAVLSAAIAFHFTVWKEKLQIRIILPILIAGLYAATDEYHQTFVSGRNGQVSDVLLDTSGAVLGAVIFCCLQMLFNRIRMRS